MAWQVLAEGSYEEFIEATPTISELPPGTRLRLEIDTSPWPVAPLADLWGMEWVFDKMLGETGAQITNVDGVGWTNINIYMTTHTPVIPILIGIGVVLSIGGLAYIVHQIRLLADIAGPIGTNLMIAAGIAVSGLLVYAIYTRQKQEVKT